MMARRMMRKHHVRCRAGEKVEITSKPYLSLSIGIDCGQALLKKGDRIRLWNDLIILVNKYDCSGCGPDLIGESLLNK